MAYQHDRMKNIRQNLKQLLRDWDSLPLPQTDNIQIPLSAPSYDWHEIWEALDSLLSTQVTMGKKVHSFEDAFADYVGVRHAVMVNSGSSANLVALSILTNPLAKKRIMPGDEIIIPSVTWSTSVFPVAQVGLRPVLVDISPEDYNIDLRSAERAISAKTRAIMPVHLLGTPCQMDKVMEFASTHDLYVIEDACEAHGAEFAGKKVGSFGDIATFSFYFSHHMSTIEGGIILTDNDSFADLARTLRAHGWVREMEKKDQMAAQYPSIDPMFLFVNLGFNLRPTEIQGAFGIHQLPKLEAFIHQRRENALYWTERLSEYSQFIQLPSKEDVPQLRRVWFGYPITVRPDAPFTREQLIDWLGSKGVATRPIMGGNLQEQPALDLISHRVEGELPNARTVMRQSFFWGNHPRIGEEERVYVGDCAEEFLKARL